jgi:Tfp pilus assembly protein PilV
MAGRHLIARCLPSLWLREVKPINQREIPGLVARAVLKKAWVTMHSAIHQRVRGFTIIEAMIATMILGLVLGSVLAVTSQSARYLSDLRRTARSSQVLQQKVEDIRLLSWSDVQALPSTFTDPNDATGSYAGFITQSAFDSYNGQTTVTKITLGVVWTNSNTHVMTNTLTTLISNGGLNKYIF